MPSTSFRWITPLALSCSVTGCSQGLFDPKGPIASAEKAILYDSLGIMLAIIIPTIVATLGVAWWYRASNRRAHHMPEWQYSGRIELVVWAIPAMTIFLLGGICWIGSYLLDPFKPIPGPAKPLTVQVVSLDWKWLFILPDQGIASVNRLVVPAATPLSLQLTSSGVMGGFIVPQLGGQVATMAGMTTQLHLQADKPGTYPGLATQFSGNGFARMDFTVEALPGDQFAQWVDATRGKGPTLDDASYAQLTKPSESVAAFTYGTVSPGLFEKVVGLALPPATPVHASTAQVPKED